MPPTGDIFNNNIAPMSHVIPLSSPWSVCVVGNDNGNDNNVADAADQENNDENNKHEKQTEAHPSMSK